MDDVNLVRGERATPGLRAGSSALCGIGDEEAS